MSRGRGHCHRGRGHCHRGRGQGQFFWPRGDQSKDLTSLAGTTRLTIMRQMDCTMEWLEEENIFCVLSEHFLMSYLYRL